MPIPNKSFSLLPRPADESEVWKLKPHHLAGMFPKMSEAEIQELASDIKKNGLSSPLVLYKNQILDGLNRFEACRIAGVVPDCINHTGDPLRAVVSLNLNRRHMNPSQRAIFAADIANMNIGENRGAYRGQKGSAGSPTLSADQVSQAQAAEICSASERTIRDAKIILREAPEEVIKDIKDGRKTIHSVMKKLKAKNDGKNGVAAKHTKRNKSESSHLSSDDDKAIAGVLHEIADMIKFLKKCDLEKLPKRYGETILDLGGQLMRIADPEYKKR